MEDAAASSIGGRGGYGEATREQEISTQAWRIPPNVNINVLKDGVEVNVRVYAKVVVLLKANPAGGSGGSLLRFSKVLKFS